MQKNKILLIQPPVEDYYSTPFRTYPLGLLYIASAPLHSGHEVVILDAMAGREKKVIPVPEEFKYLSEYYKPGDKSPYRLFGNFYHFGLNWDSIKEKIRLEKPDVIGISSLFTPYHEMAIKAAEIAKLAAPQAQIIMGGHAVSIKKDKPRNVDHVIMGEGEKSFMEYIGFEITGEPYFPARELINPSDHIFESKRMSFLLTSRGCPHACAFCSVHSVFKTFRPRPVGEVLLEVAECINKWGIRHFDIEDDAFAHDREHSIAILKGIKAMGRSDITLSLMNGLCADVLDPEILGLMHETGFQTLNLSVISADKDICRYMRRPFDSDDFSSKVMLASSMGFKIIAYCILGLPGETLAGMLDTLKFLFKLPVTIGPSLFYPVPGTAIYNDCLEKGYLKSLGEKHFRLTAASVETPLCNRSDLMTLFYLSRILNLIKLVRIGEAGPLALQAVREFIESRCIFHYFKNGRKRAAFSKRVIDLFFERFEGLINI